MSALDQMRTFAAVTRASAEWRARSLLPGIRYRTVLLRLRTDRSWQNANPAQQAEPVCLPKRRVSGDLRGTIVRRALLKEHWYPVATEKCR